MAADSELEQLTFVEGSDNPRCDVVVDSDRCAKAGAVVAGARSMACIGA